MPSNDRQPAEPRVTRSGRWMHPVSWRTLRAGAVAVIPVADSARTSGTAWVNLSLIAVNILVFVYELSLGSHLEPFLDRWGVIPARVSGALAGSPNVPTAVLLTLVTAAFLHGGWLHLGGNMLFLWIFGDNVEDRMGHGTYALFFLACAVVANLTQVEVDPTSTIAAIGASGAIAGVLGAYAVTFPGARVSVLVPVFLFWVFEIPALVMIGFWFVTQFFSGVASLSQTSQTAGIAWWAHVGGFLCGMLLMLVLPKTDPPRVIARFGSVEEEGRADTGWIGLLIGVVSLAAQLVEVGIGVRIVAIFLGRRDYGDFTAPIAEIVRLTTPLVRPFAAFFPAIDLAGHRFELFAVVAIMCVYLVGAVATWTIAAITYDGPK
jgi:membrane associated rhomboid family serine protease